MTGPGRDTDRARPVVVLFRHDLRIADNSALHEAAATGKPVVAVFVLDDEAPGGRRLGAARRWWLHHSLAALGRDLARLGARLTLRRGEMRVVAQSLVQETGADLVVWNRRYDPHGISADTAMKSALAERGIAAASHDGHLLHEPWRLTTQAGGPFRVYTPFWRALVSQGEPRDPVPAPPALLPYRGDLASDALAGWD
ncbi:MAG: deoxyribodipyrimidine photo-lyase, partial [Mesorhizobium sp.]|nr:deoxyribodipyrimidine photo-lyase [Mesorhizobium sp.]